MTRLITLLLAFGVTATTLVLAQAPRSIEAQFKAAQHKEEVEGDLNGAIEEYKRIALGSDRAIAVQALLRAAECYRKLGDAEARVVYQRIIRDYGEQPQAAEALSRLNDLVGADKPGDMHVVARQVWVGDGVNVEGSPSTDGKFLTFIDWNASDTGNVAIRDLTTGRNKRLTNATSADGYAYDPAISPDGKQIAYMFFGERTTSLRTVGVDGGPPRVIVRLAQHATFQPRWSPDGKRLAAVVRDASGDGTWRIVLIDAASGSVTTLKSTEWRGPMLGAFSPDGRFLVYAISKVGSNTDTGIYAIAVDGSRESPLVRGTADDRSPVWTPDGRGVTFLSDRSGNQDLWFVDVVDGKPHGEPAIVRPGVGNIISMGFTRDGTYFYGTRNVTQDVYVTDVSPDTLEVLTKPKRLSDQFVGSNIAPVWSPDGRYILFVRGADRLKRSIIIRSLADGTERTLPFKLVDGFAAGAFGAKWLPDSRSLLVPEADYTKRVTTIHNVDVETGAVRPLFQDDLEKLYPRFAMSPDGRFLYFTRRDTVAPAGRLLRLIKRDVVSGHEVELYHAESLGVGLFGLAISPEGDRLSFMVNVSDKGDRHLVIVPTAGGAPHIIFRGNSTRPTPQTGLWTRDGKYVLGVVEESDSMRRVWAFPAAGGEPRKLDITFESIATAELSADGRRLAFTGTQTKGEVWAIKNLLPRRR